MPSAPHLPPVEPEYRDDDDGPPGLDDESDDEDDVETVDYGSDAGGIHEDRDNNHDHGVEAWWTSIQGWCSRVNSDTLTTA